MDTLTICLWLALLSLILIDIVGHLYATWVFEDGPFLREATMLRVHRYKQAIKRVS